MWRDPMDELIEDLERALPDEPRKEGRLTIEVAMKNLFEHGTTQGLLEAVQRSAQEIVKIGRNVAPPVIDVEADEPGHDPPEWTEPQPRT